MSIATPRHRIDLEGDLGGFHAILSCHTWDADRHVVTLRLSAPDHQPPPRLKLVWMHPAIDIQGRWHPECRHDRSLPPDWGPHFNSRLVRAAPLLSLYNLHGQNRLAFAGSDALNPIDIRAGVHEETACIRCEVGLFQHPHQPINAYEFNLLIDTRDLPFARVIDDARGWWESFCGHVPLPVPDAARRPFYSTWYSFHQSLDHDRLLEQCRLARELGCEAVIVDDGWQTLDGGRGYAWCGDWRPVRLPRIGELVDQVHALGMKFLLWYSTAFVGMHTEAHQRFAGKQLGFIDSARAGVLDPRYPEVRDFLIETFKTALRNWNLDGFKLDFVDFFDHFRATPRQPGMNDDHVADATLRLLTDLIAGLRAIRPDVMIEFRQPYTGPIMRRFANLFRSHDCPGDAITNRVNTLDLRLLTGGTAVHSDMFMWHADEPVEAAALQVLNVLFAVPQVSVLLDTLPESHQRMLKFWLGFWREYRDVLLDGQLTPQSPEALYPVVIASTDRRRVVAAYQDRVLSPGSDVPEQLLIVNGTGRPRLILELDEPLGVRQIEVFDCQGTCVHQATQSPAAGLLPLNIPPTGLCRLSKGQ